MRDGHPDAVDRLQLIVANEADREAIRSMLSEQYDVVIDDELRAVDCYLVDDRSLPAYSEAIEAQKAELDPTFQPVLLLRREQAAETAPQLGADNGDDSPPLIDEVVTAPIDRETLYRRLENLLVRRRQSAELTQRYADIQTRFERLFEATNDATFVLDAESLFITACNPAASDLLGYSRATILETEPSELFAPDQPDTLASFFEDIIATGDAWTDELTCRTKAGEERAIEISATTFETSDDPSILLSIRDITERKAYQEELELKTQAIDGAPIGITISDPSQPDNPLVYVNDGYTELTGYSKSEGIGRNCRYLQGPGTREEPVAEMREAIDNEEPVSVELRNYRKDGTPFWNRVTIAPVRDDDGEVVNYIGFQEDVTERKEREQDLQLFRRAVENVGSAVVITDRTGDIKYVNPAFEFQTGYSYEEVVDKNPNLFASGKQSEEFYEELWETILDGDTWEAELVNQRKSGELYHVEQEISPITNSVGDITHFVAIEADVTDRQLREQQLSVLNRILRHNLRNGINVIEGNATLLAEQVADEEARWFVDAIEERATELAALSEKASTVRSLFEQEPPSDARYPIDDLFEAVTAEFEEAHPEATIKTELSGALAVRADSRLRVALEELLTTTLSYNDETIPAITVTATPAADRSEEWVEITVTDNGLGVPEHEWRAIEQGEETQLQHGSGLGLWLVHWTVSLLGGEVRIEGSDIGTQMVLTLPRVPVDE
ncbi:PAS domain-containing sensor histidine kinase [Halonotius aquaticus]|uniref:PAS domain-containing sensor histidine kinase n=1 Tax=Halonotius aquaticus TaxID=2216978 RepID=A0A3A6PS97_9EURY|nr:PAS domain S-box protein [Halonotius aquaticus]RJX44793.1 PAS domain-containing sensor histidine kinase [Halonotius aquaticus]